MARFGSRCFHLLKHLQILLLLCLHLRVSILLRMLVQVLILAFERVETTLYTPAAKIVQTLLLLWLLGCDFVSTFGVLAEVVRFYRCRDYIMIHVVFPKRGTFRYLQIRLHSLLTSQRVVKSDGRGWLCRETCIVMTLLEVLDLSRFAFLCILQQFLLQHLLQSVGALDLIVAPFIVHDALVTSQALLKRRNALFYSFERLNSRRTLA